MDGAIRSLIYHIEMLQYKQWNNKNFQWSSAYLFYSLVFKQLLLSDPLIFWTVTILYPSAWRMSNAVQLHVWLRLVMIGIAAPKNEQDVTWTLQMAFAFFAVLIAAAVAKLNAKIQNFAKLEKHPPFSIWCLRNKWIPEHELAQFTSKWCTCHW